MQHAQALLTDELVTDALFAGNGLLTNAARYLSDRLGRRVCRGTLAERVGASRVLSAVREIAEQRAFARAIESSRQIRRQRRSAAMKESWARRRGQTDTAGDLEQFDAPNARARAHTSSGITAASVQAMRDQRLCMATTRKGFPCVRRVVPGKRRCPNHGGFSTGPKTQAGKARIAAAQRARWERFRQERGEPDHAPARASTA